MIQSVHTFSTVNTGP